MICHFEVTLTNNNNMKTAEELLTAIRNIEDRAYYMMYYNQRLRSAKDCRRIEIAKHNDLIRLCNNFASLREKETAIEFAFFMQKNTYAYPDGKTYGDWYDEWYTKHKSSATRRPAK